MTRTVLILRPEPGASATAARARTAGFDPIIRPLFQIRPIDWQAPPPDGFDAVMMTSANAARHAGEQLLPFQHLPLYAVGQATAKAALAIGFTNVQTGETDANALAERMSKDGVRSAFHPSGVDRITISVPGIEIVDAAVYAADLAEPPDLSGASVALVHSPRAAWRLGELVGDRSALRIAAISAQAAEAVGQGWAAVAIAERPDDEALLAAASRLCDQAPPCDEKIMAITSDDYEPAAAEPQPSRGGLRTTLIIVAVAFLAGLAAMAWLFVSWDRARSLLPADGTVAKTTQAVSTVVPAPLPDIGETPSLVNGALDMRVAELEARIARINERAEAASGNAARAEGLLVAFAARRALDRGMALGYIEAQLRERFGGTQPRAVATIISASQNPVTIEELQIGLDDLGPTLTTGSGNEGWMADLRREMSELVVVRKAGTPSPAPAERLRRAKRMLEGGRVDTALAEVARMPGHDKAANWMQAARRHIESRRALDVIETAAILEPRDMPRTPPPMLPETPIPSETPPPSEAR